MGEYLSPNYLINDLQVKGYCATKGVTCVSKAAGSHATLVVSVVSIYIFTLMMS